MVSSSISYKPLLNSLNLSHNRLETLDKKIFWSTPNLETLDLSYNLLSGGLDAITNTCSRLYFLQLSSNNFETADTFKALKNLKSLKYLELGDNPFLQKKVDLDSLINIVGCKNIRLCKFYLTRYRRHRWSRWEYS